MTMSRGLWGIFENRNKRRLAQKPARWQVQM